MKIYDLAGKEMLNAPINNSSEKIVLPYIQSEMLIVVLQGKNNTSSQKISLH
jgi:hypothetical protein